MRKVLFYFDQMCEVRICCEVPEGMPEKRYRKVFLEKLEKQDFPLYGTDERIGVCFLEPPEDDKHCSREIDDNDSTENVSDSELFRFFEWGKDTKKKFVKITNRYLSL
jgi:hypothetical protein